MNETAAPAQFTTEYWENRATKLLGRLEETTEENARLREALAASRAASADDRALYLAALAVLAAWEHVPATGELSSALHRLRRAVLDVERGHAR